MKRVLFALVLAAALKGCAANSLLFSITATREGGKIDEVVIRGEHIAFENIQLVLETLSRMPKVMTVPNLEINVRNDLDHFGKTWNDLQSIGHYHGCTCPVPTICILPGALYKPLIWHEVGHAYQGYLDERADFTESWLAIAGNVYDRQHHGCVNGLLTNYAHGNHEEDVATWVEECYKKLSGMWVSWDGEIATLKGDCRYRLKLALLHEYHFLSDEDYLTLKPLFE